MKATCLPRRHRSSFWAFCSSRLNLFLELGNSRWYCSEKMTILASSVSKFRNEYNPALIAMILNHPPNRPTPLLWSITLPRRENRNKHLLGFWILCSNISTLNGEFIEMKLRDLQSLLISHIILWSFCRKERIHGWQFPWKSRRWYSISILFFTSGDRFPCTLLHGVSTCSTLIQSVKNSLRRCLSWIDHCSWISKHVSPVSQTNFMCQIAGLGRGSRQIENLERLPVDWEREIIFHFKSILHLRTLWTHSYIIHSFLATPVFVKWARVSFAWLSFNSFLENSSDRISWALFNSPTSWTLLNWVSPRTLCRWAILHEIWVALFTILHSLFGTIDFHAIGIRFFLKTTNRTVEKICSAFLLSHFRFCFCKHIIFMFLKEWPCCFFRIRESKWRLVVSFNLLMF